MNEKMLGKALKYQENIYDLIINQIFLFVIIYSLV